MARPPVDYEAVLADLESRREAIERAITGIRSLLAQTSRTGNPNQRTETAEPPENAPARATPAGRTSVGRPLGSDTFFGLRVADAARKYLRIVHELQPTQAICDALRAGGLRTHSKNFYSTVYTALQREQHSETGFVRVGRDWGLAEWYPGRPKDRRPRGEGREQETPSPRAAGSRPA